MTEVITAPADEPGVFRKRSFLKLPVDIDVAALTAEYRSIPRDAWTTSHWSIHCSCNMLLLRGGGSGTQRDFTTERPTDRPLPVALPYIRSLVRDGGPFGRTTYAFLFRMKPMGVARPHVDDDAAWRSPFRVHVPITTNPEAFLMVDGRAKHLGVGEAWTFDNQTLHAVVNGDDVRTHLIVDVPPNPRLGTLLRGAEWDPGVEDPARWARASLPDTPASLAPASCEPLSPAEKARAGLSPDGFASRVSRLHAVGRLTRLRVGDVIHAVDGVVECAVARTAVDYVLLRHAPGDVVDLGVLRGHERLTIRIRLHRNPLPDQVRRSWWKIAAAARRYAP
jgi:hypothetical protein